MTPEGVLAHDKPEGQHAKPQQQLLIWTGALHPYDAEESNQWVFAAYKDVAAAPAPVDLPAGGWVQEAPVSWAPVLGALMLKAPGDFMAPVEKDGANQ